MSDDPPPNSEIILYQTEDGRTRIQCRFENESVWLTQQQMAELFQTTKQNVGQHLKSIFAEGELIQDSVVKESLTTAADGKTRIYKDDVVIVRTGQTGACAVVDERFDGTNCIDLIIVRKSRHLRSKFLQYFLASGEAAAEITMSSNGAIQQHFNIGLVREIGLLQPSVEEQELYRRLPRPGDGED